VVEAAPEGAEHEGRLRPPGPGRLEGELGVHPGLVARVGLAGHALERPLERRRARVEVAHPEVGAPAEGEGVDRAPVGRDHELGRPRRLEHPRRRHEPAAREDEGEPHRRPPSGSGTGRARPGSRATPTRAPGRRSAPPLPRASPRRVEREPGRGPPRRWTGGRGRGRAPALSAATSRIAPSGTSSRCPGGQGRPSRAASAGETRFGWPRKRAVQASAGVLWTSRGAPVWTTRPARMTATGRRGRRPRAGRG
jgi:hypothetical protein